MAQQLKLKAYNAASIKKLIAAFHREYKRMYNKPYQSKIKIGSNGLVHGWHDVLIPIHSFAETVLAMASQPGYYEQQVLDAIRELEEAGKELDKYILLMRHARAKQIKWQMVLADAQAELKKHPNS